MVPTTASKPTATATIEPMGHRATVPRNHLINITLKLTPIDAKHADKEYVASVARRSLEGFPPANGQPDRRRFGDVSVSGKVGKSGGVSNVVVCVEGSVVWPGRPGDDPVERLRAVLLAEGYRVAVREKRECAESECTTEAMVEWNRPSDLPSGWYSNLICGKHNYRTCSKCKSIYVLTSTSSAGQAPSVHCGVCGEVMIEWGSSKMWNAELITRGEAVR
jgi:hypothetical protein